MTTEHNYVPNEAALPDVEKRAERAREATGAEQWIHHHPAGHLCDHRCGPMADVR